MADYIRKQIDVDGSYIFPYTHADAVLYTTQNNLDGITSGTETNVKAVLDALDNTYRRLDSNILSLYNPNGKRGFLYLNGTTTTASMELPIQGDTFYFPKLKYDSNGNITTSWETAAGIVGNHYIGTTATQSTSTALALTGITSIDALAYFDTTNSRVGIGTPSPSLKLTVSGNILTTGNVYVGTGGTNSYIASDTADNIFLCNSAGVVVMCDSKVVRRGANLGDVTLGSSTYPWGGTYTKTLNIINGSADNHINFSRASYNYLNVPTNGSIAFSINGAALAKTILIASNTALTPGQTNKSIDLGSSSYYWNNLYATTIYENGTSLANKYLSLSGGTLTGNLTLKTTTGDSPQLIFLRGTLEDTLDDWRILDTGGQLKFQHTTSSPTDWKDYIVCSATVGTVMLGSNTVIHSGNYSSYVTSTYINNAINGLYVGGYISSSKAGYLVTHPEHTNGTIIPFLHNDIAFLTKRGGTISIYSTTSTDLTSATLTVKKSWGSETTFDAMFSASASYYNFGNNNSAEMNEDGIIIDISLFKNFTYTNRFYIDFGSPTWAYKNIDILVGTGGVYTSKVEGGAINGSCYFSKLGGGDSGFNKLRIHLYNRTETLGVRIALIGLIAYNSPLLRGTTMSRGMDDPIFRDITPNNTNTYSLGSSTAQWNNLYANTIYENGTALSSKYLGVNSTLNINVNGTNYALYTSASSLPTIYAPTALAGTGGYILATNSGKTGVEWVAKPTSNVTTSAVVSSSASGTSQITSALSNPYYNLIEGSSVARSIRFVAGTGISISAATDGQITITNTGGGSGGSASVSSILALTSTGTSAISGDTLDPYYNLIVNSAVNSSVLYKAGTNMAITADVNNVITFDNTLTTMSKLTNDLFINGTLTATTGSWKGNLPAGITALYNGLTIFYRLPYAGSGNASLLLYAPDGTTAIGANCPVYAGTTRITTHYPAASIIHMTYYEGNWRAHPYYNTNTNVTQTNSTAADYRAVLLGSQTSTTNTGVATGAVTAGTYKSSNFTYSPSNGALYIRSSTANVQHGVYVAHSSTTMIGLTIGTDGNERGLRDGVNGKWLCYCDDSTGDSLKVPGTLIPQVINLAEHCLIAYDSTNQCINFTFT